jgi:hypothetical protein
MAETSRSGVQLVDNEIIKIFLKITIFLRYGHCDDTSHPPRNIDKPLDIVTGIS